MKKIHSLVKVIQLSKSLSVFGIAAAVTQCQACSVCIAHAIGAGLRALGAQSLHQRTTIVGLSYTAFSKKNALEETAGGGGGGSEKHDQSELAIDVLHGVSDAWMFHANIPFVDKKTKATGESAVHTSGLGDISLGATYQIPPKMKDKAVVAFSFDVKVPSGNNKERQGGELLEQHSQLGTGSTDVFFGVLATWESKDQGIWFTSLTGRWNGHNNRGFHYGDVMFYDFGYSHPLGDKASAVAEINGRVAARDKTEDGSNDPNSGGHFGYLSLSYRMAIGKDSGLVASYQLPIFKNLNGSQSETGLITLGVFKKL